MPYRKYKNGRKRRTKIGRFRRKAPFRRPVRRGWFHPKPELKAAVNESLIREVGPAQPGTVTIPGNTEWCVQTVPKVVLGVRFNQRMGRCVQMRWFVVRVALRGQLLQEGPPTEWSSTNVRYIVWRNKVGVLPTRTNADLDWSPVCHVAGQPKYPGVCTTNSFIDTTKVQILRTGYVSIGKTETKYLNLKLSYPKYRRLDFENPLNDAVPEDILDPEEQGQGDDVIGTERIFVSFVCDNGMTASAMHSKMYYIDD